VQAYYHVDGDGGEEYFMMNGQINIDISELIVSDLFNRDVEDEYEFKKTRKEDEGWGIFAEGLDSAITDRGNLTIEGYEVTPEYIRVKVTGRDGCSSSVADDYDTFLDALLDIDQSIDDIITDLEDTLTQAGFIEVDDNMSRITQYQDDQELPWKRFTITGSNKKDYTLNICDEHGHSYLKSILMLSAKQAPLDDTNFNDSFRNTFYQHDAPYLKPMLQNFLRDTFTPSVRGDDPAQGVFNSLVESYGINTNPIFNFQLSASIVLSMNTTFSLQGFNFTPVKWDNDNFELIDYMDQNCDMIIQMFRYGVYNHLIKVCKNVRSVVDQMAWIESFKPNNYARLHQLFAKYSN